MKTNKERMVNYDSQLKKAQRKLSRIRTKAKKLASPVYHDRQNMRSIIPLELSWNAFND